MDLVKNINQYLHYTLATVLKAFYTFNGFWSKTEESLMFWMLGCIAYLYTPPPLPSFSRWYSRVFTLIRRILFTFKFTLTVQKIKLYVYTMCTKGCSPLILSSKFISCAQMGRGGVHLTGVHSASLYFRSPQLWLVLNKLQCLINCWSQLFLMTVLAVWEIWWRWLRCY